MTGATLGFLAGNGIILSGMAGLGAAYLAISKGVTGDVFRTVGGIAWDIADTAARLVDKLASDERFNIMTKDLTEKALLAFQSAQNSAQYLEYKRSSETAEASDIDQAEKAFLESQTELARVLREAEAVIDEADEAIAKAQVEQKLNNKVTVKEEDLTTQPLIEIGENFDNMQLIEEDGGTIQLLEDVYAEEEEQAAPDDEVLDDDDWIAASETADEATTNAPVEEKFDNKLPIEEDDVPVQFLEEIETIDEEKREGDDEIGIVLDDDEWMTAAKLAQEGLEGKIVGIEDMIADNNAKAEWDAAGILARELQRDVMTYDDDADEDFNFDDLDLDALGKAARAAVESFETDMKEANAAKLDQKRRWADSMTTENVGETMDDDNVEVDHMDEEVTEAQPYSKDWSSMTVAQLREELKSRGLKTNGKKADLIAILQKDEAVMSLGGSVSGSDDSYGSSADLDLNSDFADFEELGRQARAAVQMFQIRDGVFDEEPTEEMLAQIESEMSSTEGFMKQPTADFAQMTVEQLKDECRSRGLKVGGKKSDLIERLESSLG